MKQNSKIVFVAILIVLALPLWLAGETKEVCSEDTPICIIAEETGDSIEFRVENQSVADITVTLDFELVNMQCSEKIPLTKVYPPRTNIRALSITRIDKEKDWKYASEYWDQFGDFEAVHHATAVYSLPFQHGKRYRLRQGYHGAFSHGNADSCGLDFDMPVGSAVCAARDGHVIAVIDSFDSGGTEESFRDRANMILIQHNDKTIARYLHLEKGGSEVVPGQYVKSGQIIGFSGNSGYSSGPHLHFDVSKPVDGKSRETIPVRFKCGEGRGIALIEGQFYTAE